MKVLILGATGRTGRWIVKEALDAGHEVRALIRQGSKLSLISERLEVIIGTPNNIKDLGSALSGCSAVLSALNISRRSDFPCSPLRTSEYLLSDTMKSLLMLCPRSGIKQIIILSAWGVGDSRKEIPWWFRWLIDQSNISAAYKDHERQENLLSNSDLDYTIIRPVGLINTDKSKPVMVSKDGMPKPRLTISRFNVAKFMVSTLDKVYNHQTITISA